VGSLVQSRSLPAEREHQADRAQRQGRLPSVFAGGVWLCSQLAARCCMLNQSLALFLPSCLQSLYFIFVTMVRGLSLDLLYVTHCVVCCSFHSLQATVGYGNQTGSYRSSMGSISCFPSWRRRHYSAHDDGDHLRPVRAQLPTEPAFLRDLTPTFAHTAASWLGAVCSTRL
jgi:hypothetical protein